MRDLRRYLGRDPTPDEIEEILENYQEYVSNFMVGAPDEVVVRGGTKWTGEGREDLYDKKVEEEYARLEGYFPGAYYEKKYKEHMPEGLGVGGVSLGDIQGHYDPVYGDELIPLNIPGEENVFPDEELFIPEETEFREGTPSPEDIAEAMREFSYYRPMTGALTREFG